MLPMNPRCIPILAIVAGTSIGLVALGQPPVADPANSPTSLAIAPTTDLPRLLDLVALRLKVQIDYDPANPLLKGQQVTLRQSGPMADRELWLIASRLLVQRGLTTVRGPGSTSLTVVKLEDAQRLARLEPELDAARQQTVEQSSTELVAGYLNQPVRLTYVSLKEANEVLRVVQRQSAGGGGGTPPAGATAISAGDLVVLSDTAPRVDELLAALRKLDTPDNATVVQVVPASNVSPIQLAAAVTQLATKREAVSGEKLPGEVLPAGGGATVGGGTGSVMIVAPKRVVERWKQFIALADQRESVTVQTYSPRLFSVKEVGALIQQIAGAAAVAGSGGTGGAGGDERFKVVVEEPTGSLIVTATVTQHEKIAALMARLDSVPGESRRPVRSFLVRNRPVDKFVATLQRLISAGVIDNAADLSGMGGGGGGSPSAGPPSGLGVTPPPMTNVLPASMSPLVPTQPGLPQQAGAGRQPVRRGGAGGGQTLALTLTADEATNTIIAVGDGRLLDQLDALIKTLDVRQPQVMLEAIIVSLSDDDTTNLGVELQQLSYSNNMLTRLSSVFGLGPSAAEAGPGLPITGSRGGTAIVLDPGDYAVIVRALQTVRKGKTVSAPKVLVSNNEEATLNSVKQVPFAASFTAGNASTPTTSYGGSQDAGTQLKIRPQIGDGGGLLLDYNISISQFGAPSSNPNLPPDRDVTSVQSLATIPDGYAIVVTGLELKTDGHEEDRVPLLGELPVVGNLFKSQTDTKKHSKFFVFIRASVMRDQSLEALRFLSDADAAAAKLPTSWPKSTPQVVR